MKYFTKEELEEITGKILENPTRRTLKELNDKYNGDENTGVSLTPENIDIQPVVVEEPQITEEVPEVTLNPQPEVSETPVVETVVEHPVEPIPSESTTEPVVTPLPPVTNTPVVNPLPNVEIPVTNEVATPEVSQAIPVNNVNIGPKIPSFEIPQMVTPDANSNTNQEPINFTGNLWEPQEQDGLMTTTDSFNEQTPQMSNTEVPVQNGPFFGNTQEPVNNPIPIQNAMPHIPQGPSMFGQFEQNYNG